MQTSCLEGGRNDFLLQEGYATAFLLDHWIRLHDVMGDCFGPCVNQVFRLRKRNGGYKRKSTDVIWVSVAPPGPPKLIQIPHFKGTTTARELEPTNSQLAESELAEAELGESGEDPTGDADPEEAEDAFTGLKGRLSDSDSKSEQ